MAFIGTLLGKAANTITGGLISKGIDSIFGDSRGLSVNDQRELMEYQNQLNMDAWHRQFTTQAQYNDPSAVASRYRNAGINPASAFDKNVVGISQATMSNPVTGFPAPNRVASYVEPNAPQYLSSIAQLISSVSGSKLNEAQANAINEKLFKELRAMDDAHEWQELTNGLLEAYGYKKASAELKLALANVQKAASESKLNDEQALSEAKKRLNIDCDIALKELEKDLSGVRLKQAKIDLDYYRKFKEAQLDNLYSQSEENRASAREHVASADEKELKNNISRATNLIDIENALFDSDVITLLRQSAQRHELWQEVQRLAISTADYLDDGGSKEVENLLERLAKICGLKTSVSFSPAK